jgi:transposase-like protein
MRLAVLEAVFERDMSIRKAAAVYGIDKNSAHSWAMAHRNGKLTLEQLRADGVEPVAQVLSIVEADGGLDVEREAERAASWKKSGGEMREKLLAERQRCREKIERIDKVLNVMMVGGEVGIAIAVLGEVLARPSVKGK